MAIGLKSDRPNDTEVRAGTLALHWENYYPDRSGNDII